MSAIPGHNFDDGYLQFVVGLLDDSDNYSDYISRDRADSITELLKRERADSISDFLKRDRHDSITDFLPKQSDFLMRDRAFSWDLNLEEQMHSTETAKAKGIASSNPKGNESTTSSSSTNSTISNIAPDKKRKYEAKSAPAPPPNKSHKGAKSPPLPSKVLNKSNVLPHKSKLPTKSQLIEQNNAKKNRATQPTNHSAVDRYAPKKPDTHQMTDNSMPLKQQQHFAGSLLSNMSPHSLTRYDNISVHMLDHAALLPLHNLDSSISRVGAYTKEERQAIIAKFRAKKMRRVWRKQIKYDCRKRLADTRPRVKGRFVSRKEPADSAEGEVDGETELETVSVEGEYDDE